IGQVIEVAVVESRLDCIRVIGLRTAVGPPKEPNGRSAHAVAPLTFVRPAAHLARRAQHVSDEAHPIGVTRGPDASPGSICGLLRIVYASAAERINEGASQTP